MSDNLFGVVLESAIEMELKLRTESEIRYHYLFNSIPEAIIIYTLDSRNNLSKIVEANDGATKLLGYSRSELLDISPLEKFLRNIDSNRVKEILDNILNSDIYEFNTTLISKYNTQIEVEVISSLITYREQDVVISIIKDVTKELQLEKKSKLQEHMLIQQGKMAEMGEMIGAIAHQWKQPLNSIALAVQSTQLDYELDGDIKKDNFNSMVDNIIKQVQFMSNTIDTFRNFFKPSKELTKFSTIEAIESVISILANQFSKSMIEINIDRESKSDRVVGYLNEFKQVILNILNNAKDIIVENREKNVIDNSKTQYIDISIKESEEFLILEILDFAGGVPEEIERSIFQPYFSTKGEKGTGIGLYLSKSIIEKIRGELELENFQNSNREKNNGLDRGAKFKIKLRKD